MPLESLKRPRSVRKDLATRNTWAQHPVTCGRKRFYADENSFLSAPGWSLNRCSSPDAEERDHQELEGEGGRRNGRLSTHPACALCWASPGRLLWCPQWAVGVHVASGRWRLREGEYPAKITQVARGRARIHVMRFGVTPKLLEPLNVRV